MPSLLSMAPGASQGLDDFLQRMLLETKLKNEQQNETTRLAETGRHNTADEGLRREQIASTERERVSRDAMTNRNYQDQSDRAARDDGRALAESIPSGTVIPETDPAVSQMGKAGMGGILRGIKSRPAVDTGPLQPEDTGAAVPVDSVIKLKTSNQQEKADSGAERAAALAERTRHDKAVENKPPAPDRVLIQTPEGYVKRSDATATLSGGGTVSGPESAQTKNRRDMADAVSSHFDDVNSLIDEADQKGLLGPLKGRTFTEFMAGKVGSTGNAENDALLGELRTQLSMIRTGTASLHGRTGANVGIAKDIEKKMDEGFMDPAQLKGALKGLRSWVDRYAKKPGAAATGGKPDLVFDPGSGTFKKPE